MTRRLVCFLSFALTCLASCSQRGTPQKRLEQYFFAGIHKFGDSRAEIISNLGKPTRTRTGEDLRKANELSAEDPRLIRGHGGAENEIFELTYEGLLIKVLKVKGTTEFIYDIRVASDNYEMLWNLNVGSRRDEVRRILGIPSSSDGSEDYYNVVHYDANGIPEGYEDFVSFSYIDNVVTRILFLLYLD